MGAGFPALTGCALPARPAGDGDHPHLVEFYETKEFLVETVSGFLGPALVDGDAAIVVATAAHRRAFEDALHEAGLDVGAAVASGRYLTVDAAGLLTTFMVDGAPDARRFRDEIGGVIERAAADGRRVRIYGEMVALLWDAGDVPSAIALEDLWNDLAATHAFALLCAYPMSAFESAESEAGFRRVCEQHTAVIPGESYSLLDGDDRDRAVARLQQETAALRADVARLRSEQGVLAELAYVDAVTGLANRRAFDRDLEREWTLSARDGIDSFVLVADLDDFKDYNDRYRHAAGDELLRQFAGALRVVARSTDLLARIGGDEFAVLLVRCREESAYSFKARVGEEMVDGPWPGLRELGVSIGHASIRRSTSPAKALERAALAMFACKRAAHQRIREEMWRTPPRAGPGDPPGTEAARLAQPPLLAFAGSAPPPRLVVSRANTWVVVTVHGDLVDEAARSLGSVLEDLVDGQGNLTVVVDLANVGMVDRTAARVLWVATESTGRRGGTLRLRRASPAVMEGLDLIGAPTPGWQ